jgi:hypothetical protein
MLDKEKKALREKKHRATPKGKATQKKAQKKADKSRIEGTKTYRFDNAIADEFIAVEGKNPNERMRLLLDIRKEHLLTKN